MEQKDQELTMQEKTLANGNMIITAIVIILAISILTYVVFYKLPYDPMPIFGG